MNCRKGDIAIAIYSEAGNEGKIMQCLEYIGSLPGQAHNDLWLVDAPMHYVRPSGDEGDDCYFPDSYLKPLRGGDGVDEMVRIAGRPERVEA